jgi:hypothetical protein
MEAIEAKEQEKFESKDYEASIKEEYKEAYANKR